MKFKLPSIISVFPLSGVIFFPETNLPLNIFEPRYMALVNDSMKSNKYMGMIQSKKNSSEVYSIGCLGKITDSQKVKDGRVLINLVGITRFEIKSEINNDKYYREFEVSYDKFKEDIGEKEKQFVREKEIGVLSEKIKNFFKKNGLLLNWKEFEKLDQNQRINTLAMIAPISNEEKQSILESVNIKSKTKTLFEIIEFYLHENSSNSFTLQ
ncbi:LON peptidase substrate-binding domain-containing protein [Pelagibacteraceae bacterium]|nr:LON peptidase substrate-binding domain-containing protein [Pelagibacteraceae bacterium]